MKSKVKISAQSASESFAEQATAMLKLAEEHLALARAQLAQVTSMEKSEMKTKVNIPRSFVAEPTPKVPTPGEVLSMCSAKSQLFFLTTGRELFKTIYRLYYPNSAHCVDLFYQMKAKQDLKDTNEEAEENFRKFSRRKSEALADQLHKETAALFDGSLEDEELYMKIYRRYKEAGSVRKRGEILNVLGKDFEVHPNLHFAKLINSIN
jgi:hypothetical protein